MAFKDNAVELEERVVAINRVTKVVPPVTNIFFIKFSFTQKF